MDSLSDEALNLDEPASSTTLTVLCIIALVWYSVLWALGIIGCLTAYVANSLLLQCIDI